MRMMRLVLLWGLARNFNFAKFRLVPCQYESQESYALTLVEKHLQLVEATHQARQKYIYENEFMTWIHDQRQGFTRLSKT